MQSKIYFAKSNRANPNTVMAVRALLESHDVEIVEYKGGHFSHQPMLDCDYLVVLPEHDESYGDEELPLGKGLHEQIQKWEHNNNMSNMFIVYTDHLDICMLDDIDVADYDDYVNYSVALLGKDLGLLGHVLENRLGPVVDKDSSSTTSVTTNEYQYLLIGTN